MLHLAESRGALAEPGAGNGRGLVSHLLDEPQAEPVIDARGDQDARLGQQSRSFAPGELGLLASMGPSLIAPVSALASGPRQPLNFDVFQARLRVTSSNSSSTPPFMGNAASGASQCR